MTLRVYREEKCISRKSLLFDTFDRWHLWYNFKPLQFFFKRKNKGEYSPVFMVNILNVERKVIRFKVLFYFVYHEIKKKIVGHFHGNAFRRPKQF